EPRHGLYRLSGPLSVIRGPLQKTRDYFFHKEESQTRISPWWSEPLEVTRHRPSGLKARPWIKPAWPRKVRVSLPLATSQIFTVASQLPEARYLPSGLKTTFHT